MSFRAVHGTQSAQARLGGDRQHVPASLSQATASCEGHFLGCSGYSVLLNEYLLQALVPSHPGESSPDCSKRGALLEQVLDSTAQVHRNHPFFEEIPPNCGFVPQTHHMSYDSMQNSAASPAAYEQLTLPGLNCISSSIMRALVMRN